MPVLVVYILKLSISLSVVYLFYRFALRKLTFYTWNRWYLLGYSLLSFFIAFLNVTPLFQNGLQQYRRAMQFMPSIDFYGRGISAARGIVADDQNHWNGWNVCLFILAGGMAALTIRLFIQYFSFLKIRRNAELLSDDAPGIYHLDADIIPFSFGNSIFINKRRHSLEELQEIVRHEFVHVKQKHSIDILWSELLCIINWYNPFSWLLRAAIRQNLEFIADGKVLEGGVAKKEYQYLLLKVIGNNHFRIASKFNFSSLKKRIAMMNKMRTARVHIVKFLFILPLVAVLLIAFRKKEHERNVTGPRVEGVLQTAHLTPVAAIHNTDTTPKLKKGAKQLTDRTNEVFEITDKKAVIHLHNGKTEEYDLTDSLQRQNFEANYGKIISVAANEDELAPVSVVAARGETVAVSGTAINTTVAPVVVTTNGTTVMSAKTATSINSSVPVVVSAKAAKNVTVADNIRYAVIADEEVLVTITKSTTAKELEDFKNEMKGMGYQLSFDKTTYSDKGTLTHVSGTIKSNDGQTGNFSATDFDRVILARVKYNNRIYWRIDVVDRPKHVI